ncbi:MAG TPA: c-type cytochrome [Alphaproteobacteria bacterium]|nr:c-type cytochrome [Alphaproteobacteria bacterium]
MSRVRLALPAAMAAFALAPCAIAQPDINNGRSVVVGGYMQEGASGAQTGCFQCHGLKGEGDPAGAFPRLADQSVWYLYDSLKDYASGARQNAIMTPIAQALSDQQMQDVAAYYAAQEDVPYPPPPKVDPMALQRGAAISAIGAAERGVQACINCHGPSGVGMPPSYPYLAGQYADYMILQLNLWREGRRGGDPLGVMEVIAKQLTNEDIEAVSRYFASVRVAEVTPEEPGTDAVRPTGGPEPQARGQPAPQLGIVPAPDAPRAQGE